MTPKERGVKEKAGGAGRVPGHGPAAKKRSVGHPFGRWRASLRVNPGGVKALMSYIRHLSTGWHGRRRSVLQCCAMAASQSPSSPAPLRLGELDAPAFSPLYQQIKTLLVRSLQSGEWRPGEAIPSEVELAARFKVSQGTVRKAIDELATENLLVRRQGKGSFVATHAEEKVQFRFLRLAPDTGADTGAQRRFIDCRRLRAPSDIARALDLKSGDTVVQVRRVLSFAGTPVVLDDIWLPGQL